MKARDDHFQGKMAGRETISRRTFLQISAGLLGAAGISLEKAVIGSPVPFHPGAARYYKEKGITVRP
jgi:TRAP-type uncharacterized transport system substrate-binding protein